MKIQKIIFIIYICIILVGCATGSSIITGNVRQAISPNEVKIYIDPPSQYETIGIVESSSDVEFSTQAAQDRVIDELKSQAAKIGANGVLIMTVGNKLSSTGEAKTAHGQAIYVIQKQ